jgi:hypothetical protein
MLKPIAPPVAKLKSPTVVNPKLATANFSLLVAIISHLPY